MRTPKQLIKQYSAIIQPRIKLLDLPNDPLQSGQSQPEIEQFHREMTLDYPLRRGKYIRSILMILTSQALGLTDEQLAFNTATAFEICQSWLLVHDDIEDNSTMRRGEPALHLKYGTSLAINAGDTLHLIMWKLLAENRTLLGAEKSLRIIDEFYTMLFRTTLGQTAELKMRQDGRFDISESEYFYIVDGKTSYYTIAGPMRIGAMLQIDDLAHLEQNILPQFNCLGVLVGRAFQLIDDVLDVTGDFQGKKGQVGGDLLEGKRTLLLMKLLERAPAHEKTKILVFLEKDQTQKQPDEVFKIIELLKRYDCIEYCQTIALSYINHALEQLESFDSFQEEVFVNELRNLFKFIINRQH